MTLEDFVRESNKIEGILRDPLPREIDAHEFILGITTDLEVEDLRVFVGGVQPNALLRDREGLNVYVGNHVPPRGGPDIPGRLQNILDGYLVNGPYNTHALYETLHPFTDGNGRSGRALWLWTMKQRGALDRALGLGFLHAWYYQSLQAYRS